MNDRTWSLLKWSGIGLIAALILAVPYLPGHTEPVTRERLNEARALWTRARIGNYDLDLETRGAQSGRYHVEVRGGHLAGITRDGVTADPAAGEYWTVDGLFQVIEEELDAAEQPDSTAFGARSQVWLRARYDSQLGYPIRFVRVVKPPTGPSTTGYAPSGASLGVEIQVQRLTPIKNKS
jgi:Family of unknown function (DUF6174)